MNTTLAFMFLAASQVNHLPQGLLSALCWVESGHRVGAINHDDKGSPSIGVCEVKLETARGMGFKGTAKDLMDPKTNIKYASRYLAKQLKRYDGVQFRAIAAYNAGSWRTNELGATKNIKYVSKVFTAWAERR